MEAPALALLKADVDPKTMVVTRRIAEKLGFIGQIGSPKVHCQPADAAERTGNYQGWLLCEQKEARLSMFQGKGSSNPLIDTDKMRQVGHLENHLAKSVDSLSHVCYYLGKLNRRYEMTFLEQIQANNNPNSLDRIAARKALASMESTSYHRAYR